MIRPSSPLATGWLLLLCVLSSLPATSVPARAQPPEEPVGGYVFDVRGTFIPFPRNVELATARDLPPLDTPGRGLGYDVGGHVYVFRLRGITFGLGASLHRSSAEQRPGELSVDPDGPTLRKRFSALSSQLSFNFGSRNGWSYLSGGLGTSRLSLFPLDAEEPAQRSSNTLNYGGGVRWFLNDRVAFSVDLRFYAISPLPPTNEAPGSPRMTQMTINAGASFR
ncbi:MAG: hypothetical protein F4018_14380 [Acidobacteria bacterium]|nr:hypothetical protein [Acidobacteriota bacterium]MYH31291.1 hypothetical protein [Acidobacteriota bacterium]MYK89418.1 hypothetical protein [Acidobacteriota bacterium]